MVDTKERTFIMVKPDGVQRGLVGKIIQRFEQKGFKLVAMKLAWVSFFYYLPVTNHPPCFFYYFHKLINLLISHIIKANQRTFGTTLC